MARLIISEIIQLSLHCRTCFIWFLKTFSTALKLSIQSYKSYKSYKILNYNGEYKTKCIIKTSISGLLLDKIYYKNIKGNGKIVN